jgi:predicted nucleic acid-binding Zn ribbon protein
MRTTYADPNDPDDDDDEDWKPDEDDVDESDEYEPDNDDSPDTMPCPYCKREIDEDSVQCPRCGNYLSREDQPAGRDKPTWVVITVVLLLIAFAMCIFSLR